MKDKVGFFTKINAKVVYKKILSFLGIEARDFQKYKK